MRDSCLGGCLEGCLIAWLFDALLGSRDEGGPGCGCLAFLLLILIAAGAVIAFFERF